MSTEGSPAPTRPLCSRCSVTPPPGSADFRREFRSGFVFPSFWAMRVRRRKQRSSKTTCPSQGPRFLPRLRSVRPSVCLGEIKRKHDDEADDNKGSQLGRCWSRRGRGMCDGSRLEPRTRNAWKSSHLHLTFSPWFACLSHLVPLSTHHWRQRSLELILSTCVVSRMLMCQMLHPPSSSGWKEEVTLFSCTSTVKALSCDAALPVCGLDLVHIFLLPSFSII